MNDPRTKLRVSQDRFSCLRHLLLALAFVTIATPHFANEMETHAGPSRPDDLLFTDEYYRDCDLNSAAARLRADAARWNIDENQVVHSVLKDSGGTARAEIFIPGFGDLAVDTTATDFLRSVVGAGTPGAIEADLVAIVMFRRMLTVGEVATLFEHDVRILQLLRVGRGDIGRHRAAIVRATPGDLTWLSATSPFMWMGPYDEKYKFPARYRVKDCEEFSVSGFKTNCTVNYADELAPFGIEVIFVSGTVSRILVKASLAQMMDATRLPWIKHVSSMPASYSDFNGVPYGCGKGHLCDDTISK